MDLSKRVLHTGFAVEVKGVDMRVVPSDVLRAELENIINEYLVVVFPDQKMTDEQQMAFCRPFGELQRSTAARTNQDSRLNAEMTDASNLTKGDKTLEIGDQRRMNNLGSRRWHTDGSYNVVPVKYSFLSGRVVAARGGETQFADMRAGYDALSDDYREMIEDLKIEHSRLHSREMSGFPSATDSERAALAPVHQKLVRRHPSTDRKSLYLSSHASHVVGWPKPEGMDLLSDLTDMATQPQFVYTHKWKAGDVVFWDNRFTMHRARRHFPETAPRDMRRVSIMDIGSTLEQAA